MARRYRSSTGSEATFSTVTSTSYKNGNMSIDTAVAPVVLDGDQPLSGLPNLASYQPIGRRSGTVTSNEIALGQRHIALHHVERGMA
jgi:hypothetical protein